MFEKSVNHEYYIAEARRLRAETAALLTRQAAAGIKRGLLKLRGTTRRPPHLRTAHAVADPKG